ncbi:hypothetical protein EZV63_15640 [Streptomyces sp. VN1]|nr:hypothetical protein EZV63_15640 [Streptomyces sp. VN1]
MLPNRGTGARPASRHPSPRPPAGDGGLLADRVGWLGGHRPGSRGGAPGGARGGAPHGTASQGTTTPRPARAPARPPPPRPARAPAPPTP